MTAFFIGIAGASLIVALALVVMAGRERRRVTHRLDRLAVGLGRNQSPSDSPMTATERLEVAVETWRASVVDMAHEHRYRAALEAIPLGVVVVDANQLPLFVNDTAAWFREGRHGEAVVAHAIDRLLALCADGGTHEETIQLYGPPRRRLHVTAAQILDDERSLGTLVLIDDVTEQERIDAIRRDFITNISHELRTPIGAMSLLAETLVGETDIEVVESLAERLSREADRLATTVDDLLELSRIEHSGDVDFEPIELQGVVAGAHDRVRSAAQQRGVEIGVTMPEKPLVVMGDRRQLTSAVFNLLDNGVKYSGPSAGVVSIRARLVDEQIELTVQDGGIGIPRKDLDRVFERFYRVDSGRSRHSGGTGLGLSMVRHIVANHGGRIGVDSVEGEGTTFTIFLPAVPPPDAEMPPDDRSDGDLDHEMRP
ncbi:MAG: ATP-binding protein [Acidimicrobiales bacterium]